MATFSNSTQMYCSNIVARGNLKNTFILLTLLFSLLSASVQAQTYRVSTEAELRAAINAANSYDHQSTIFLENDIELVDFVESQIFGNTAFWIVRNIVIDGNGFTLDAPITGDLFRFFLVGAQNTLTLNNIKLQNGGGFPFEGFRGGAIFNLGKTIINNSSLEQSRADLGGAIYNFQGEVEITHSKLLRNAGYLKGSHIFNDNGEVRINNTEISENYLTAIDEDFVATEGGGSIYNNGFIEIKNSSIRASYAVANDNSHGGFIYNDTDGEIDIENSTFGLGGIAGGKGGFIYNKGIVMLNHATIAFIGAGEDGVADYIYNDDGTVTLKNSLLLESLAHFFDDDFSTTYCFNSNDGIFNTNANNLIGYLGTVLTGCVAGETDIINPDNLFSITDEIFPGVPFTEPSIIVNIITGSPTINASGADALPYGQLGMPAKGAARDIGASEFNNGVYPVYPTVQFAEVGSTNLHTDGTINITIQVSEATDFGATATVYVLNNGTGTANAGEHFERFNYTEVSIDCSGGCPSSVTIPFTIREDGDFFDDVTVDLKIVGTNGFATIGDQAFHEVTILRSNNFSGGNGSAANPWQIETPEQLNEIRNYLSSHFILTANIDLTDATREGGDYWNEGLGWEPIGTNVGTNGNRFSGNLNGNGFIISGLFINRNSTNYVGLFGRIAVGARVRNLGLTNLDVTGRDFTGSLAGSNAGSVTGSFTSNGTVTGNDTYGGFLGLNSGSGAVINSYTTINVSGNNNFHRGGFVGNNAGDIYSSFATGSVTSGNGSGGFVGDNTGIVSNSYWNIETSGMLTSDGGVGLLNNEMRNQASFVGFSFDEIWQIENGTYSSYPYLQTFTYDEPGTEPEVNPIPGLFQFNLADVNTLYVNQNVNDSNGNGDSWIGAMPELRDALVLAQEWDAANGTLQIWVASGVYLPTSDPSNRQGTFQLVDNVEVYGGFAGGETEIDERDWKTNLTILSGDINNSGDLVENTMYIVTGSSTNTSAVLDGFTITGGNAVNDAGAGVYNSTGSPTLRNVIITGNTANAGAGMANIINSNPTLVNVAFIGNTVTRWGGGLINFDESNPSLINVTFSGNTANFGGAIYNVESSNPVLTNVIVSGNTSNEEGSIYNDESSTASISFSLIEGSGGSDSWNAEFGNDGGNNIDVNPQFTDPENGDYTLLEDSPAINAGDPDTDLSIFSGGSDAPLDLAGNPRVSSGNIDMGAYEFQGPSPVVAAIEITGAPGWRMLGAPFTDVTVADLANQNLIQGIPGLPYDGFDANLFMWNPAAETGDPENPIGAYVSPGNGSNVLNSGTGFIWFMWGELENVEESKPFPLTLELTGMEPAGDVSLGTLPEGWNLIANPFAESIAFDELTNGTELINIPGYVWDPNEGEVGSYLLTTSIAMENLLSVWEGAFIELDADSEVVIPQTSRQAAGMLDKGDSKNNSLLFGQIEFMLEGLGEANDVQTRDRAAILYFHEQATEGWDSWDVSKLIPLSHTWATAAFVGERDGKPVLKAQHALPYHVEGSYDVPMDIQLQNTGGDFRLSWPVVVNLPEDAEIMLLDTHTGQQFDLGREGHVDFAIEGEGTQTSPPSLFKQPEFRTMGLKNGGQRFMVMVNSTATSTNSGPELPAEVELAQNYPNPFNPTTIIRYELPESHLVRLDVYEITGRLISTLVNEQMAAGTHTVTFDAQHLASGMYIYRLQAGGKVISRKLTLIK